MAMETQDIIKRSATNPITPAPRARDCTTTRRISAPNPGR